MNQNEMNLNKKPHLPPGKYGVILFDLTNRFIDHLYHTTISDICEEDSVLLVWVKPYQVDKGLELSKHWGFRYCTCLVWNRDKENEVSDFGEILLVSVKGCPPLIFDFYEGSKDKPSLVKEVIKIGYPGWSKVEIFVDKMIVGWELW